VVFFVRKHHFIVAAAFYSMLACVLTESPEKRKTRLSCVFCSLVLFFFLRGNTRRKQLPRRETTLPTHSACCNSDDDFCCVLTCVRFFFDCFFVVCGVVEVDIWCCSSSVPLSVSPRRRKRSFSFLFLFCVCVLYRHLPAYDAIFDRFGQFHFSTRHTTHDRIFLTNSKTGNQDAALLPNYKWLPLLRSKRFAVVVGYHLPKGHTQTSTNVVRVKGAGTTKKTTQLAQTRTKKAPSNNRDSGGNQKNP